MNSKLVWLSLACFLLACILSEAYVFQPISRHSKEIKETRRSYENDQSHNEGSRKRIWGDEENESDQSHERESMERDEWRNQDSSRNHIRDRDSFSPSPDMYNYYDERKRSSHAYENERLWDN